MSKIWSLSTLRHGETDFNVQKRYAGTLDVSLNDVGRQDICRAASRIESGQFEVILSSPLQRALETASLLARGELNVIAAPDAYERNYGAMQGLMGSEVERFRPPIFYIRIANDYHSINPPDGETLEELHARATRFYNNLLRQYAGQRVLLVSHGVFLQQLHGVIRGRDWIDSLELVVHNLELTTFHFEDTALAKEEHVSLSTVKDTTW